MATDKTRPLLKRRWRTVLMAGTALLVGSGAIGAVAYKTDFGDRASHTVIAGLDPKQDDQAQFAKLMDRARQALAENRPRLAVIFLKNAVASAPKDGDARLQLGVALLKAGDAASAERELRSARQAGVSDERLLPVLFNAMLARSEGRQLLAQFPAPAEGDRGALASETLRARGIALTQADDSNGAAAALDRALTFDRSAANLLARAQLARRMGDAGLAMNLIEETLSKSSKDVSALMTKVDLLAQANQNDQALAAANDLVKYYPNSPEALMTRAGLFLQLHQHEKALADINASLKIVPNMVLGVYYKALAAEQAKDVKQAWDLAQNLPPAFINSRPEIGSAVSQIAIDAGHLEIGTSILSGAVSNFPKNVDARVRLAARYLQLKDAKRALETLLPMENSPDPRIMVLLGQAYDMQHHFAKSIEYLEKANATGIGGDPLKRQIAISNLQAGNLDSAINELEKLNAASQGDPQTAGLLIGALMQRSDYGKALDVAQKLESAAPNDAYGPFFQGQILLRRGDPDGAVSSFSRAIALDEKFVTAMYERAVAFATRGDLKAADADLNSILSLDPKNMMVEVKLAQVAVQAGQKDKAVALLKEAATAHPKEALPTLILAGFEMQERNLDNAAAVIASFLKEVPDNADALAMQGEIQLAAGNPDRAAAIFRQLANGNPKSPQIQMFLGAALAKSGNAKDAMDAYQKAVQLAPNLQAAHVAQIQYALASRNEGAALSAARDYAEKQPGPLSADTLARTYAQLNRNTDAVNVLAKSQAEYPNSATLVSLTALLRQQGDVEKADSMLTDWIAEHPDDVAVRIAYAGSQLNANVLAAEAQYRAILKLQPYNADALNNFGWLLQQKNPKEALPYCERAAKIAPNSAAVLDTLAWTKWLLNDKSEALSLLERAHAGDSKNGEITYHLVLALDGNGRHEDARKLLVDLLGSKIDFLDKSAAQTLQAQWR